MAFGVQQRGQAPVRMGASPRLNSSMPMSMPKPPTPANGTSRQMSQLPTSGIKPATPMTGTMTRPQMSQMPMSKTPTRTIPFQSQSMGTSGVQMRMPQPLPGGVQQSTNMPSKFQESWTNKAAPVGERYDHSGGQPTKESWTTGQPSQPSSGMSEIDQMYQDMLGDDAKDWERQQALVQGQMGAFGREADIMNARMNGGMMGGGYAGLAGAAMGKGVNAMEQADLTHRDRRREMQLAWMDKKLDESKRQEERGWQKEDNASADDMDYMRMVLGMLDSGMKLTPEQMDMFMNGNGKNAVSDMSRRDDEIVKRSQEQRAARKVKDQQNANDWWKH